MREGMILLCLLATVSVTSRAVSDWVPDGLETLSPEVGQTIELKLAYESFHGMELDEAKDFDGWTWMAEASMPIGENFRLRLSYPFRTRGDAIVKDDHFIMQGESIDIDGNGGVFDFLTFTFEHQLKRLHEGGYGLSYYLSAGAVPSPLETTLLRQDGNSYDAFNHTGTVFLAGIRLERQHDFGRGRLNLGLRYYGSSDDLNPGGSDQFWGVDFKAAVVGKPWGSLYPIVEFTYFGDFSKINQVALLPELAWVFNRHLDVKLGAVVGLGGNGSEWGMQAQAAYRF